MKPTGRHRVYRLSGGQAASVDELVRGTKRGLLVTRFWYNRMLEPQTVMLTGLTRDGLFLIEDGKVTARALELSLQRVARHGAQERRRHDARDGPHRER